MSRQQHVGFVCQVLDQRASEQWVEQWLALTLDLLHRHRRDFDSIANRLPSSSSVSEHFVSIVREMFNDGKKSWGRTVTVLAFATYLQQRYSIDLKSETSQLLEEQVYGSPRRMNNANSENFDFPDSFFTYNWLAYGVLVLLHNIVTELL